MSSGGCEERERGRMNRRKKDQRGETWAGEEGRMVWDERKKREKKEERKRKRKRRAEK